MKAATNTQCLAHTSMQACSNQTHGRGVDTHQYTGWKGKTTLTSLAISRKEQIETMHWKDRLDRSTNNARNPALTLPKQERELGQIQQTRARWPSLPTDQQASEALSTHSSNTHTHTTTTTTTTQCWRTLACKHESKAWKQQPTTHTPTPPCGAPWLSNRNHPIPLYH